MKGCICRWVSVLTRSVLDHSNDTKAKWPSNGTMAPLRSETRLFFEATSKEHEKERRLILLPNLALVPDHGDSCIEVYRRLKPNIATS